MTQHFAAKDEPTKIEIEADDKEGLTWRYVLHVDQNKVIHEALYKKKSRYSYVFIRDLLSDGVTYDVKQQGFGLAAAEAKKVRANASLISTALQYGVELAQHVGGFVALTNINIRGRNPLRNMQVESFAKYFAENENIRERMVSMLTSWDLGLSGVPIRQLEYTKADGTQEKFWAAYGAHTTSDGATYHLTMEEESGGTQSAFVLLALLLHVLEYGGLAVIDEMESDLHPDLVGPILEMFDREETNPTGAQIIFTCHSSKVLDLLQKSQAYFVEKRDCQSDAFRGDEVEGLRNDDNLRAKYEAGAIGAIPRL